MLNRYNFTLHHTVKDYCEPSHYEEIAGAANNEHILFIILNDPYPDFGSNLNNNFYKDRKGHFMRDARSQRGAGQPRRSYQESLDMAPTANMALRAWVAGGDGPSKSGIPKKG
jgi:hypothetical protein